MPADLMKDPLVRRAHELAKLAHGDQKRDFEDEPYIRHPERVALTVAMRPGATPAIVAAALLHDVLEDTDTTAARIAEVTNDEVLVLVRWLTKATKGWKAPRGLRKRVEAVRLSVAPWGAKVVKLCDRLDNVIGMLANPDKKFRALYGEESLALAEALGDADLWLKEKLTGASVALMGSAYLK